MLWSQNTKFMFGLFIYPCISVPWGVIWRAFFLPQWSFFQFVLSIYMVVLACVNRTVAATRTTALRVGTSRPTFTQCTSQMGIQRCPHFIQVKIKTCKKQTIKANVILHCHTVFQNVSYSRLYSLYLQIWLPLVVNFLALWQWQDVELVKVENPSK